MVQETCDILVAVNLFKYFEGVKALDGSSVVVAKNKVTSLIGPNGCGKTTLFNVITGWLSKSNPILGDQEKVLHSDKDSNLDSRRTRKILDRSDIGYVKYKGNRIDSFAAHEVSLKGLMRTFFL